MLDLMVYRVLDFCDIGIKLINNFASMIVVEENAIDVCIFNENLVFLALF